MKKEDFVRRVESVLNTLECGFKFERVPNPPCGEEVAYVCRCGSPVTCFGMTFEVGLLVGLFNHEKYGWSIEYDIPFDYDDMNLNKRALADRIKRHMGTGQDNIEKIIDGIYELVYAKYEVMHEVLGNEIERRMPDVEFVDRHYYAACA